MFSSTPHIELFAEMDEIKERMQLPEPTLIIASLESKNKLDDVGGKQYIEILLSKEENVDAFKEFVNMVILAYKARMYLSVVSGVNKENLSAANVDEAIYQTRRNLDGLLQLKETNHIFHVRDLAEPTFNEIMARTEKPGIRGSSWGVNVLNTATGGKAGGDLWIVSGRPGSGKTALICNSILADGMAGIPSLLIEREMRKQELMERLISIDSGVQNDNIRLGVLNGEQKRKIRDSLEKLKELPLYFDVNTLANDPLYLESTITKYHDKYGVQNVYLDYIQLATERGESQTADIGRLTRLSKLMANDLSICMILLSQLNRNLEYREDKRPILSDMKQAGTIEEDADFVVGLYRDEHYNKETKDKNKMEFIILKHRNGPTGVVTIKFHGPTYRISEG
jgi:replicative DNA helicase